jgi:succinate dehydrogenase hydrophobic anchor subunit
VSHFFFCMVTAVSCVCLAIEYLVCRYMQPRDSMRP